MNKGLQALIAVAALVVIAAGAVYLMDARREAEERADRAAAVAMVHRFEAQALAKRQQAAAQAEIDACAADLAAYDDRGQTAAFVARATADGSTLTGDTMLAEVEKCREMVAD